MTMSIIIIAFTKNTQMKIHKYPIAHFFRNVEYPIQNWDTQSNEKGQVTYPIVKKIN